MEEVIPITRLRINGLGHESEKNLIGFFGNMVSAKIVDIEIVHKGGFGFIEFEKLSQYEEAKLLGKHVINGRNVKCEKASYKDKDQVNLLS